MKKLLKPEMEFIEFDTQDVITTSGEGGGGLQMNFGNPVTTEIPAPDSAAENKGFGGWQFSDTLV